MQPRRLSRVSSRGAAQRGHRKPGGPPGGGSPHGATPSHTRSLLRKRKSDAGEKRNRGERKKKTPTVQGGGVQGYSREQSILLVGEGNLSMARALLQLFEGSGHNLVATTYDTEEELQEARARSWRLPPAALRALRSGR